MDSTPKPEIVIEPGKSLRNQWSELWRFRELFYIFVWRDIKVRYKQTALGVLWAILQPFLTMVVFTIFFGNFAHIPSDGIPYPIFVYTGLLLWTYFITALSGASSSMIDNENMVKKVYFPRLILPISTSVTPAVDFLFALIILFVIMLYYHFTPSLLGLVLLPLLFVLALCSASGIGLFFAAINTKYRDVRYVLPFFIQILLFLTPVIYPSSIIPARFQWIVFLNPMAGVISSARTSLLSTGPVNWHTLAATAAISVLMLAAGMSYFKKTERFFADVL